MLWNQSLTSTPYICTSPDLWNHYLSFFYFYFLSVSLSIPLLLTYQTKKQQENYYQLLIMLPSPQFHPCFLYTLSITSVSSCSALSIHPSTLGSSSSSILLQSGSTNSAYLSSFTIMSNLSRVLRFLGVHPPRRHLDWCDRLCTTHQLLHPRIIPLTPHPYPHTLTHP